MPKDTESKPKKVNFKELTPQATASFLNIIKTLIDVKVEYSIEKPGEGTKILTIDLPFIKGYLVVGVYLMGKEIFVGYVEIV